MDAPEHFQTGGEFAVYRPVGNVSLQEGVELVNEALRHAGEQRIKRLLIDVRGLTGFASPTVSDRYWFIRKWAQTAAPGIKVVIVAKAEMIDPEKFGITVARNAGLESNVFPTEEEARAWLLGGTKG